MARANRLPVVRPLVIADIVVIPSLSVFCLCEYFSISKTRQAQGVSKCF